MAMTELNDFFGVQNYPHTPLSRLRSIVGRLWGDFKAVPSILRNYYERARYGVGHRDVWSFDTYLAGVIALGLRRLADGHSYPTDWEADDWDRALRTHADSLEAWANHFDLNIAEEEVAYARAKDSMHWVASVFGDLWD